MTRSTHKGSARILASFLAFTASLVTLTLSPVAHAETPIPRLDFVVDETGILTPQEKETITEKLRTFKEQTSNEMALLIVQTTEPETIEQYSIRVAETWKLGKEDKDNGILFTVAVQDRKMRLEIGQGLEGVLTDLASTKILNTYARPAFRAQNYFQGINDTIDVAMATAKQEFNAAELPEESTEDGDGAFAVIAYVVMYVLILLYRFMASTKSWWHGGVIGAAIAGAIALIFTLTLFASAIAIITATGLGLLIDYLASKNSGNHHGSIFGTFWSGGGSGGGFSGGGFSGGGGSFSGGGGSSSW